MKIIERPLILASKSPRRQFLLRELGLPFEVQVADVDETPPPNLPAKDVPTYLAELKAQPFVEASQEQIIIGADTIVLLDDTILGKPSDEKDAVRMLRRLSARMHVVITGVTLLHQGEFHTFREVTNVYFRALDEQEIEYYVQNFRPLDKAGAYGIQEWIGYIGVSRIEGDYYNVMGLPVFRLYAELKKLQPPVINHGRS